MKLIALTFDDGPNTSTTPQVLDLLAQYGIPASFFLIAQNISHASAEVVKRAVGMGCEIENHSTTHRPMDQMSAEEIRREVDHCTEKIISLTGRPPRFFRPPYIAVSRALMQAVPLTFICGSGCLDWEPEVDAAERAARTLANARDGEIILLHDSAGNDRTVEALKTVIPALIAQDYRFVTCGQLFDMRHVSPRRGWLYSNVLQNATGVNEEGGQ